MLALVVLFAIAVYIFISSIVVWVAGKTAHKLNKSEKAWRVGAVLLMYHLVLWDLVPGYLLLKFYCITQSGTQVYQDVGKWANNNPDGLKAYRFDDLPSEIKTNFRFRGKEPKIYASSSYEYPDGTTWKVDYSNVIKGPPENVDSIMIYNSDGSMIGYRTNRLVSYYPVDENLFFGIKKSVRYLKDLQTGDVLNKRVTFRKNLWLGEIIDFRTSFESCGYKQQANTEEVLEGIMK